MRVQVADIRKAMRRAGAENIEISRRGNSHIFIKFEVDGTVKTVTVSSTPRIPTDVEKRLKQEIRRVKNESL